MHASMLLVTNVRILLRHLGLGSSVNSLLTATTPLGSRLTPAQNWHAALGKSGTIFKMLKNLFLPAAG